MAEQILALAPAFHDALRVFTEVPGWAIVHAAADNRNAPLVRQGEVVVVESNGQAGWYPVEGGLFLIEYVSPPTLRGCGYERRTREIVQTRRASGPGREDMWLAASCASPRSREESERSLRRGILIGVDGPYTAQHLADRLIGKVVGIYDPRGPSAFSRA